MTDADAKKLLVLSSQADTLERLRAARRISQEEYIARLNDLREKGGFAPIAAKPSSFAK